MSYEIAIINPRQKKRRSRKAPSKAQRAARARFVAKFAKGRKARKARKARKSTNSGVSVMAKRRKRRSSSRSAKGRFTKKTHAVRRRRRSSKGARRAAAGYVVGSGPIRRRKLNPRVRRRRYRRNPLGLPSLGGLTSQVMPAALGAGGAIALNVGLSFLPLPDQLKTGWMRHGTRFVGALALGWAAKKFLGAKGNAVALGALTVVMYDIGKQVLQTVTPELGSRLGDFEDVTVSDDSGFYDPASVLTQGAGAYLEGMGGVDEYGNADDIGGVGAYLEGDLDGNLDGLTV